MTPTIAIPTSLLRNPDDFGGVVQSDCRVGKPVIRDRRLVGLMAAGSEPAQMVIPALAEAHCHLDKCHTLARLGPVGGDLRQAIAAQWNDKSNWTEDDLRRRMSQGLQEAIAAGCSAIRSHVDWGDTADAPLAWHVLNALAQDLPITLQTAALVGIDQMADQAFAAQTAAQVAAVSGVLGAFILGHVQTQAGLRNTFTLAQKYGLMLDFHVDEGLEEGLTGLEQIADMALEMRFEQPILCGHAVSLMNTPPDDVARIADKLARAQIAVCALPVTNLYLQGRCEGTPDRRGITRLRELHEAGVSIVIGSDNVADAFCPTGAHDPMQALNLGLLTAHLDPPLAPWLRCITVNARAAMGLDPIYVDDAPLADLMTTRSTSVADMIAGRAPLRSALSEIFE